MCRPRHATIIIERCFQCCNIFGLQCCVASSVQWQSSRLGLPQHRWYSVLCGVINAMPNIGLGLPQQLWPSGVVTEFKVATVRQGASISVACDTTSVATAVMVTIARGRSECSFRAARRTGYVALLYDNPNPNPNHNPPARQKEHCPKPDRRTIAEVSIPLERARFSSCSLPSAERSDCTECAA
jgi:hypothetical protein